MVKLLIIVIIIIIIIIIIIRLLLPRNFNSPSDFRSSGMYAAYIVRYQKFGTTHRSHLHGSNSALLDP